LVPGAAETNRYGREKGVIVTVSFLFRKPKFPIICDIEGYVIAAKSISGFEKQLSAYNICKGSRYPIIDITGEGWSFYPEHMAISPLTTKKKWFKKEVIAIFNNRKNNASNVTYSEKSISAKRYDKIFQDIVGLLLANP
jgi:hypothetical protein